MSNTLAQSHVGSPPNAPAPSPVPKPAPPPIAKADIAVVGASRVKLVDIIYNMTAVCPHDCAGCCVDAAHAARRGEYVHIRTDGLANHERVPVNRRMNIYDIAAKHLQATGRELAISGKLAIVEHLDVPGVRLDISGGDPLCVTENIAVVRAASARLGRTNLTLTATGAGMAKVDLSEIVELVGEFNFTFDGASIDDVADRPRAYASRNLALGKLLSDLGGDTRAEFPITRSTNSAGHVERLYMKLHEAGIKKLLLMRLFAVGRGAQIAEKTLGPDEYRAVISQLRELEAKWGSPKVHLQCALRHLENAGAALKPDRVNPCDLARESFGLTPNGVLLASPWAIDGHGRPIDDVFILGNLAETSLSSILASERVQDMRRRADENFGHCKIFAFQHSKRPSAADRLFDRADPLYTPQNVRLAAAE